MINHVNIGCEPGYIDCAKMFLFVGYICGVLTDIEFCIRYHCVHDVILRSCIFLALALIEVASCSLCKNLSPVSGYKSK